MAKERSADVKKFRDNAVAGDYVRLSATAVRIVDTPPFQRLRYLKQLGMTEYVYPGATHTRFAHSLGVAHRAKDFARRLKAKQPELQLSDSDLLVLEIAALCHDLGHGPFSHSFESELLPKLLPPGHKWEHEDMSCRMFDHICHTYDVDLSEDEQQRVKDLILGDRGRAKADWSGREWQFDIVANKRNGLDVDKLDYLKRDNVACGELTASEFSSLYENMRVINGEVCFRSSVRSAVQQVYSARAQLHEFVYTHPVAKAVEYMVVDALLLAADELRILDALDDPERFALLDDTILRDIERSPSQSPGMRKAQELLKLLRMRDIYKHCGSVDVPQDRVKSFPKVTEADIVKHQASGGAVRLQAGDIRVHNLKIDYTMQHENPLTHVGFYMNEKGEERPMPCAENPFAPGTFITRQVRVYLVRLCDSTPEKQQYVQALQAAFGGWCRSELQTDVFVSPQKSTLTASARKRQHRSCSSQHGATPPAHGSRPPSAGEMYFAAAASGEQEDEQGEVFLSQSAPDDSEPPGKKRLTFANGA